MAVLSNQKICLKSGQVLIPASLVFVTVVVNLLPGTPAISIVSLVVFIGLVLSVFLFNPHHVIKYLFLYYLVLTNVLGVAAVEFFPVQLKELGVTSYYSGSLPLLVTFHALFLGALYYFDTNWGGASCAEAKQVSTLGKLLTRLLLNTMLLAVAVLLIVGLINPFFSSGLDRFQFRNSGLVEWLSVRVLDLMIYCMPIASLGLMNGYKKRTIIFLVGYVVAAFLYGYKFNLFLQMGYLLILGLYPLISRIDQKKMYLVAGAVVGCVAALVAVVFVHNYLRYDFTLSENGEYFAQRLAQQGQLWWRIYDTEPDGAGHFDELGDELNSFFSSPDPSSGTYGIYKIMLKSVADEQLFYTKISNGSRYASSTPVSFYYYFGPVGMMVFSIVGAFLYSYITNLATKEAANGHVIGSVVASRFIILGLFVFAQSDFDKLFSWMTVLTVVVYIIVQILYSKIDISSLEKSKIFAVIDRIP